MAASTGLFVVIKSNDISFKYSDLLRVVYIRASSKKKKHYDAVSLAARNFSILL
jgi:hypothetical protein